MLLLEKMMILKINRIKSTYSVIFTPILSCDPVIWQGHFNFLGLNNLFFGVT